MCGGMGGHGAGRGNNNKSWEQETVGSDSHGCHVLRATFFWDECLFLLLLLYVYTSSRDSGLDSGSMSSCSSGVADARVSIEFRRGPVGGNSVEV